MATLLNSESRRLYSWWWDSHNTPKNSKWLQENLTDMDGKVKSMIKLIEEDADSFARRAEMYYKKRPELMKLVEEFYRAYRALAERYNHATGELRHAHRTIAEAFPDQVPFELLEDSPSKEPHTPEIKEVSQMGMRKMGLKQLHEMFEGKEAKNSKSGEDREERFRDNENFLLEIEKAGKAESEVQGLKKALADMKAEKEDVLLKYQRCLEKLCEIEGKLDNSQKDSIKLNEKAGRAEIEVQTLKEALIQLEAEKNAGLVKNKEYLEKISQWEAMVFKIREDMKGQECDAQNLKDELSRLELEKEAVHDDYKRCLGRVSELENIISVIEDEARLLKKQAESADNEVFELKKALADIKMEKEASAFQYKCCLETISKLEKDLSRAKEDVERLNNEILIGNAKLKNAEENYTHLEMSNQSLRDESDSLAKKISLKDQELSKKQEELEKLESCLKDEHLNYAQLEATLQNLHCQSRDDQRALTVELENVLRMLKGMEITKNVLEEEILKVRDENHNLTEMSLSSAVSMDNMQNEILSLRDIKERLEKEVSHHMGLSVSLQQEILCLKEEIKGLNRSYGALVEEVEAAGLNPKCVGISVKSLKDENSRLRELCEEGSNEKAIISKKLENMEEDLKKKVVLQSSLSELNGELENSRENVKALKESCEILHGEKSTLAADKASLLSQLQTITENMHKLLEKNVILENSLSMSKVELESLREKSKGLEDICEILKNQKSDLLTERDILVLKLEHVERRLEILEKRFTGLEEKYADLEKEKKAMHYQVEDLKVSLCVEKQERTSSQLLSQTRLAGLENKIHLMQEENTWKKKEFEEELDKALEAQFEISILQKFMKDMEEKNYSLVIECQKHVEASKLADKVISELESESLEQQVEAELLLDEIERLKLGIYQIFRVLETGSGCGPEGNIENEQDFVHCIVGNIEDMKCSIYKNEDEKQQLLVENSVLLTLLEQLESKGKEIESQKKYLESESKILAEKLYAVQNEKDELIEINEILKLDVDEGCKDFAILEGEQADLQKAYNALQEAYSQVNQENTYLLKKFSDLKEEKYAVDQYNDVVLVELLAISNQSVVLKSFGTEKIKEVKLLLEDLNRQHEVNSSLEKEMSMLRGKLELQTTENIALKDFVRGLEREMQEMREYNVKMNEEILKVEENLIQTEAKLSDTEMKLEAAENLNSILSKMDDELRIDFQESLQIRENLERNTIQLSEKNSIQKKEIESLHIVNKNLESELILLREEIEKNIIKEQNSRNEFELWKAEASTFFFDLQVSSVHEVLFEDKVEELTGVCQILENERDEKISEFEQMKGKICFMENEISGLNSRLRAYEPVVASLQDDITLLEHNALLQTKTKAAHSQELEFLEVAANHGATSIASQVLSEDQPLLSLQNLQTRVKSVGRLMEEMNKPVLQRRSNSIRKQETEIDQFKPHRSRDKHEHSRKKAYPNELNDTPKLHKIKTKSFEAKNGMLMKDIPLDDNGILKRGNGGGADDQMLELWETAEDGNSFGMSCKMTKRNIVYEPPSTDSDVEKELRVDRLELSKRITEPKREVNDENILEKLSLDAKKLEILQTTVENLRKKMETNRKSRKVANFETIREQLVEAEDNIVNLVDLNGQLVKNIEYCPSDKMASPRLKETVGIWRRKVNEQAEKGSERIVRLELELQKIQYILLKMEDEKKNKGRNKFSRSRTVILRDFVYDGRKNSGRRKKGPFCGCFKQSTSGNGRSS
ncbi:hypothetical protein BUALT_Bualt12G0135200 [Buddleja alternifolia]|uniref:NAB domain-containing protein n=1 Tax=Buddleja alternifolia TaxID=168488 RepID=A0AAV6WZH2_9LAMI|nr:hypothetical protein BUALT_Bualt12G0135200 [Buddleja alternifolia]